MIGQQIHPAMFLERPLRQLALGQWVRSQSGLIWHHGIITGFTWDFATNTMVTLVTHSRPLVGVAETTLDEFSSGPLEICGDVVSGEHGERSAAIAKANISKGYNGAFQNCEHFASFCFYQGQKSESKQVQGAVALALGVVGLALVFNSEN